ncbi:MAG: HlyD family efflux transporter periplasmic adaptor subunit [Gammaproteobacteria bacterium]
MAEARQAQRPACEPTPTPASYLDAELWSSFSEATTSEAFAEAWLALQCAMIPGVEAGVVVLGPPDDGPFAPVAFWPRDAQSSAELSVVAESAMEAKRGLVRGARARTDAHPDGSEALAYPILVEERLHGVCAIEVRQSSNAELQVAMRQLQWGCAWIETLIRRRSLAPRDHLVTVLDLVALCMEHERFAGGATALATELATSLDCDRVSLGFLKGRHVRVEALSHSADFGRKSNLMRAIGNVMDEALDQQDPVVYPPAEEGLVQLTRAHHELARQQGEVSVCTVPLNAHGRLIGAITLERNAAAPFDRPTVELCTGIAAVVGPLLEARRKEDRWVITKVWDAFRTQLHRLFGAGHLGFKLAALALLALAVFLLVARGTYRITADAALEGRVQRVLSAAQDGYVFEAGKRAGDVVRAGEVLAALDDRDLRLESVRRLSEKQQHEREYSHALAAHEWSRVRILGAKIEQAAAHLTLLEEQLKRTRLLAPFDGIVVSGDLSQRLGAPVSRGEVLFEVAPLDGYRIILSVDERDISQLRTEQGGHLALAGLPDEKLPFTVTKITPVSATEEGRNYFKVEAALDEPAPTLRPGMEGVAKVDIDRRRLIWIWTYKAIAWVKLALWTWL